MLIGTKLKTALKSGIFGIILLLSINVATASTQIFIQMGPMESAYYRPSVVYVPGHWYHGFWVPGQYVQYRTPVYYGPSEDFVWYRNNWYNSERHHHHHF